MKARGFGRTLGVALALAVVPVSAQLVSAPAAGAAAVTTIYYSSGGAPDYVAQIDQAAANWNAAVSDIKLVKRTSATIIFHETHDGQGSYTNTNGHGRGNIYIDSTQVAEGFDTTRIAAHEVGHNLGLPDDYTGPCNELMSGHGPGTSCTWNKPSAAEAAQVQRNFTNGFAAAESDLEVQVYH
jgi:snapalysin